jgi:DNA-binding beta-propeller fold protein YncE
MRLSLLVISLLALIDVSVCSQKGVKKPGSYTRRALKGRDREASSDDDDDDDDYGTDSSKSSSDKGKKGKKGKDSYDDDEKCIGTVVVGNRGDGTLSILDANLGEVLETIKIPWSTVTMSQPVPVDVETVNGIIYVSDSANDRVVAFDGVSYEVIAMIPTGDSPGELSTDSRGSQLWVTNTADNTVIVIDLAFNVPIRSIEAFDPNGVVDFGTNVVNDVLLSPSGDAGFVTYAGNGGLVVRFDSSGAITASNSGIGDTVRLAASFRFNCLYVPSTSSNVLDVLFNLDLQIDNTASIPSPFDAESSLDGQYIYITSTTNNAIHTFDVGSNSLLPSIVTTAIPNPTKLTHVGDRLFVSHGDSDQVSVFSVSNASPIPIEIANIDVGDNPFGISYCKPTSVCSS